MDFMKKFRIGSGLQNFHIRTPLLCTVLIHSLIEMFKSNDILLLVHICVPAGLHAMPTAIVR